MLQNGRRSNAMTNDKAMAPPHTNTCWSLAETPNERTKLATARSETTMTNWPASTPRLNLNKPPMKSADSSRAILKNELNPRP